MADIYAGQDLRLSRRIAIKFLRIDVPDARTRERFQREARAAAAFNHPNAVTVYDVGEDGSRPYLVMELVDGGSVAQLLGERGRLNPDEALAIIDQVLGALAAAHAEGLVHRDIKPSNILLAADGTAKLADFGIAKVISDATAGLTATGEVMGTAVYLSPEQVSGQAASPRSDIYAVGVVLYEMLVGVAPFVGDTQLATALAHVQAPVPSLAAQRPELTPELVAVVERALQKDPERRFPDAESMRRALASQAGASTVPLGGILREAVPTEAMAVPAAAVRTAVLPANNVLPDSRDRRAARWSVLVAAGATLVVVIALVIALTRGNEGPSNLASPSTTATPATTAAPVPSTTSGKIAPPTAALPSTIDALIARLASDPGAAGKRGPDLLKDLQALQTGGGKKSDAKAVQGRAKKAIGDITKWVRDGQLDPAIGALAQQILEPLAG
jgi:eukaryotic-like serine/threonine-protein kinase